MLIFNGPHNYMNQPVCLACIIPYKLDLKWIDSLWSVQWRKSWTQFTSPYHVDADPDPSFHLDFNPNFFLTLKQIRIRIPLLLSGANLRPATAPFLCLFASLPLLWASTALNVSTRASKAPNCLLWCGIWIQLLTLMQIRIQLKLWCWSGSGCSLRAYPNLDSKIMRMQIRNISRSFAKVGCS